MLPLILMAALAGDQARSVGLAALEPLAGCSRVPGQVRGKSSPSIARGQWRLGGRYFTLQLRATTAKVYEAAITYGAGEKAGAIGSIWHDTFGGLYEPSLGSGERTADGFVQIYRFPDSKYVNRFGREGDGWRWAITEVMEGKSDQLFASYRLQRAACRTMRFTF